MIQVRKIYAILLLVAMVSISCSSDLPYIPTAMVSTLSVGEYTINKIDFISEQTGIALTDEGSILRTSDGTTWGIVRPTDLEVDFTDLSFTSETEWYILGFTKSFPEPKVYRTQDAGITWEEYFIGMNVTNISFPTESAHFITEGYRIYKYNSFGYWDAIGSITSTETIEELYFQTENIGFVTSKDGGLYKTKDGGYTWEQKLLEGSLIRDFSFSSDGTGIVSRNSQYSVTLDNGETWEQIFNGDNSGAKVCVVDQNHVYNSGAYTLAYTTTVFNNEWNKYYNNDGTSLLLNDLHFTSARTGYGVYGGTIYKIINNEVN